MSKDREIGEIIDYYIEDVKLKLQVVKSNTCTDCFFAHKLCDHFVNRDILGHCSSYSRKDNISVIFKKIN